MIYRQVPSMLGVECIVCGEATALSVRVERSGLLDMRQVSCLCHCHPKPNHLYLNDKEVKVVEKWWASLEG